MSERDRLTGEYNVAVANGLIGKARRIARVIDALPATPAASGDVEAALGRLSAIAASMVRAEGVCEKPHRNGEAHPHIHWGDSYIARARDIVWAGRVLRAAIRAESAGALDVERFETAWRNVEVEDDRVGIIGRGRFIDRIAAEYARLAEDAE